MSRLNKVAILGVLFVASTCQYTKACVHPNPHTYLRLVIIDLGPPVTITLVYDPWLTFGTMNTSCAAAFQLPMDIIDTVDAVRLVETGTDTLIAGFGPWNPNATTEAAVEALHPAGAGNQWFGFLNTLAGTVPANVPADFQVDVTLKPGETLDTLSAALCPRHPERVFTDEANANGTLMGTHEGLTAAQQLECPAVSQWGVGVLVLLVLTAGTIVVRRHRARVA
jgi:hypothetical protein